MNDTTKLLLRAESLVVRLEKLLPAEPALTDWKSSIAFRWRKNNGHNGRGALQPVNQIHRIQLKDRKELLPVRANPDTDVVTPKSATWSS